MIKKSSLHMVYLLGVVSLFADITYEGARSIVGPYLFNLGATAKVTAFVAGLGELIGFFFRIISGYVAEKTKYYWGLTIFGYIVNLFSIPLLGFVSKWETASVLILAERFGKAIRVPPRDAILASQTDEKSKGFGFGIHEALDQIGAVCGPLVVWTAITFYGDLRRIFLVLSIPAFISIIFLFTARTLYKKRTKEVVIPFDKSRDTHPKNFVFYIIGVCFIAAGFSDFALVAFHFKNLNIFTENHIPLLYACAMLTDGLLSPIIGKSYDLWGMRVILFVTLLSAFSCPLLFFGGSFLAFFGVLLWGISMGAQESAMRAHVASLAQNSARAFGFFNAIYGISWFLGSALMGFIYESSLAGMVIFASGIQLLSLPFLVLAATKSKSLNHLGNV